MNFFRRQTPRDQREQAFTTEAATHANDRARDARSSSAVDTRSPHDSRTSVKSTSKSRKGFFHAPASSTTQNSARLSPSSSTSPASTSEAAFSPPFSPSLTASTDNDTPKLTTNVETKTLAIRLQELAIANADGLLDEDEYRLLRQQAFETHSRTAQSKHQNDINVVKLSQGTVAVPKLNGIATSPGGPQRDARSFNSHPPTTPPLDQTETLASPVSSPLRAPSIASHQSKRRSILPPLNSFFRRDASSTFSTGLDSDWDVVTPPLSSPNDDPRSRSPLPLPSPLPLSSDAASITSSRSRGAATLSPPISPVRNRSIRNHPGMASAALDSRASSYFAAGSSSRSSTNETGYYGAASVTSRGRGEGARSNAGSVQTPRSPTLTRTRPSYTSVGVGGVASGLSLHGGYSSNHSHDRGSGVETLLSHSLPPITSSTDPLLFAATGTEPTVEELRREIEEIEDERERMRRGWNEIVERRVASWEDEVGPAIARRARAMFSKTEDSNVVNHITSESRGGVTAAVGETKKTFFKRASILPSSGPSRPPRSTSTPAQPTTTTTTKATGSDQDFPPFLRSTKVPLPPDLEANLASHQLGPTLSLRTAMEELFERQRRTEVKYERRLEFLRAKEKGARIKQRLFQ